MGKSNCNLNFATSGDNASKFWKAGSEKCQSGHNMIFVQYACEMTEEQKFAKYEIISKATFTVLLCSAFFFITIYYMQHTSDLDGYMFDVSTVTAADYSVELDITKAMWDDFEANQYEKERNKPVEERVS